MLWTADLKIVLSFCICTALAYHGSKEDYIKWRERFLSNKRTTTESALVTSENDIYYENLKLRHNSRYPNLDRVMSKIDNLQGGKKKDASPAYNKVRHQNVYRTTTSTTTTDEGLFGDYYEDPDEYDDTDNDDGNEYDDWEDEGDDSENTADYGDPFSDDDTEWQAEEATEPTFAAPVSSLTKYKWDNYGTRSRVEASRRQQLRLQSSSELRAAKAVLEHYMKMEQNGQCRKPLPKVISVQSVHPDPSKSYTPHCTILHRCAEDTGCCSNHETKCGPKTQVPVHVYFYAKTLGVAETKVEKLTFYNHTECTCVKRSKQEERSSTSENTVSHGLVLKSSGYPENLRRCQCPTEFTARFHYASSCSCDCEEHNHDCIGMKKGKEYFGLTDRKCILSNECGVPFCEYGIYLRKIGRCQRKHENLDSYSRMTVQ